MVLGAEERVVAERLGQLTLRDYLLVKLPHRARQLRVMVVDGKDRVTHG
jgi:hypothetical protein